MRLIVTIVKIGQHLLPRANFLFSTLGHRRIDSSVHFLSFLPLAFLVTNIPSSSRYIFRVALSLSMSFVHSLFRLCPMLCVRACAGGQLIAHARSRSPTREKSEFRAEIRCTKKRIDSKGKPVAPPLVTGCTRSFRVFTRAVNLGTAGK